MAEILKGKELDKELRGREPLTGSIKLRERNSDSIEVQDDFEIEGVLHAGGSCICYKATRFFENSDMAETGTLKEFYPVDSDNDPELSYNLKRYDIDAGDLSKQLYSEESTLTNFINAQQEFKKCYEKISDLKLHDKNFDSFFAPIRIYRGISGTKEKENHTIYIWNPGDSSLKSFDDYLSEMQDRIKKEINDPKGDLNLLFAYELHAVLQTIKALAIGIESLHCENFLHLDIKPSNFGVRNLGVNDGDNISVSLFDVNTIYSRSHTFTRTGGTPYFRAPEMIDDVLNNYHCIPVGSLSDVYSLGATLYNSIIINSDGRGLYETKKFSGIDTELSHSLLIECSEYNSKAELHDILSKILKRSLARAGTDYIGGIENYDSIGEFIKDIGIADEIIKIEIAKAVEAGANNKATIQIVNKEEYYDSKIDGGSVSSMQCLLYDHPLYDYVDKAGNLNLLVLGAGVFGQKFIDIAFELSQIKNCYLNITVVTNEKEKDESRYLNSRPEFKNYFWVNGQKPKYDDYGAYGSIKFVNLNSELGNCFSMSSENNIDILKESLKNNEEKFSYVFISLSDEQLNCKLACDLVKSDIISPLNGKNAVVNFVTYKDFAKEKEDKTYNKSSEISLQKNIELNPVKIKNTLINHKDYRFLSRMAFNCHLLWGDGLNVDINKSYGKFRSVYNYTSSFANALSIKYKLHSIGLELSDVTNEKDRKNREEALRILTQTYRNKIGTVTEKTQEQKNCLNELTMYEHRRWIVNMICSSSYEMLPENEFKNLKNSNKDKRSRKHTCIVPSRSDWALNNDNWTKDLCKWDEEGLEKTDDFKKLDHLDKMSIKLHRHFMALAKKFNIKSIETDAGIVRRYLYDKPEALAAFNSYLIAMRAIPIRKSRNDTAQETFNHCSEVFSKYLKDKSLANIEEIKKRVKNIEDAFAPVKMAYDFTDYKAKDQKLIYNIPFILNYSTSVRLCVPFVKGKSNNEWFRNVASSIVINPSMLTYLVDIEEPSKIVPTVKSTLSNITRVMDGHSLQTKIALILYTKIANGVLEEKKKEEIEKELKDISSRIYSVDIIEIKNQKDLVSRIKKTFETNQKSSSRFSAIEINDEFISGAIYSIEDLSIPTYEFESMNKSFRTEDNEEGYIWFSDIPFNTHLNIEDMFIAQGRLSVYKEPELHQDYKEIWDNCYFDSVPANRPRKALGWKALCTAIKNKTEKDNVLMDISVWNNSKNKTEETDIFVPTFCRAAIEKIFSFLSSSKIQLIDNSKIKEHNSSMLRISFKSTQEMKKAFLKLFDSPYALIDETKIRFIYNGSFVQIIFESLIVSGFAWDMVRHEILKDGKKGEEAFKYAQSAFDFLVKKGYIIKFYSSADEENMSFCFASSQIKELLSNEGQLLELYTYYQTIERGYFDEIKIGLEVQRRKSNNEYVPTQEFDLVAVKGFRTQIVEIKARKKLQQEFYQKLKSNGDNFGINKELVLVSHFGDNFVSFDNKEFIERGKEDYDVQTVFDTTDIENIGETLTNMMNKGNND